MKDARTLPSADGGATLPYP